jgi:hypothetical protein
MMKAWPVLLLSMVGLACSSRSVGDDGAPPGPEATPTAETAPPVDGAKPGTDIADWCANDACPELCKAIDCTTPPFDPDDYDGDGLKDSQDNCPWVRNKSQTDADGDAVGDACDLCPNVPDKEQADADGDGIGDACDSDMDNDGKLNPQDNCPKVANPSQSDTDKDGEGDLCDADDDNDKIADVSDNCPLVYNPMQEPPEQLGNPKCDTDIDMDKLPDGKDNCPSVANPDQKDTDGDKLGDMCDPDLDGDGVLNLSDNCLKVVNADQKDTDRDGKGDVCDSRYCMVIKGDEKNCLDPQATFRVYSPMVKTAAGQVTPLHIYINRTNVGVDYKWVVTSGPSGKRLPFNFIGSCGPSPSEFCATGGKPAAIVAESPGEYRLKVIANLQKPDPVNPNFPKTANFLATVIVEGTSCIPAKCVP